MPGLQVDQSFTLSNPWGFEKFGVPLRAAIPLPRGAAQDPAEALALVNEAGEDLVAQWTTLVTWPDGSVRFALLDYAEPTLEPRQTRRYRLTERAARLPVADRAMCLAIDETEDELTIDTGRLTWTLSRRRFSLAEMIAFRDREWLKGRPTDLCVADVHGQVYRASRGAYHLSVESAGEHRAVILIEGDYRNPVGRFMNYTLRLHFTAGGTQALLSHTVRNREDGREGRDLSRLWLEGSLEVDDDTIRRVMHVHRTVNTVQAMIDIPENVELETRDDLTTIRNVASLREDPDDRCYSIVHELDVNRHGGCAPMLDLHEPGAGGMLIRFAMPEPEREAPMRLASEGNGFEVDFYPAFAEPMHLGEGMGKTRDLVLHFHDDALPAMDVVHQADVLTYPGVQSVSAAMYRDAQLGDIQHALPRQPNKYMMLEQKIDTLLAAQWAYDWPVATGWRDFGDEIGSRGRCPEFGITQYINNEEDYLYCLMIEGWRRGVGLMPQARKVARHLMDIDFIDHSTDPARDGATCPHSTNHTDGEVYPSHQWCQGLLYYYLTTGDPQALRVSRRIGDNLIWWITGPRRDSLTYSGRESAWPLLALAALYDVTRDAKYRDAGMIIIDSFKQAMREHGRLQWEYPPGSGIWSGYMHLMTFNGIWDMYAVTGDASILELWKQASKPVVDALEDPHSFGYLHFRNWPIKWADLNTLMRWYHLTGDEKYVRLGRNGLRLVLAGAPQPLNQTQGFIAMGYRHFIFFMSLADEHGMIDDNACTLVW